MIIMCDSTCTCIFNEKLNAVVAERIDDTWNDMLLSMCSVTTLGNAFASSVNKSITRKRSHQVGKIKTVTNSLLKIVYLYSWNYIIILIPLLIFQ